MMNTYHIHITGIVQGVGFRPFVYKLAAEYDLKGWVNNSLDGVRIEFNEVKDRAHAFYKSVLENAPSNARIYNHSITQVDPKSYSEFEIIHSDDSGEPDIPLTPDFALCETCRKEIRDQSNQRFNYPFTTCTYCGPRYSIVQKLPYDRHRTTMVPFTMCEGCDTEYNNPLDRRYFSQTNSCGKCGIQLQFVTLDESFTHSELTYNQSVEKIVEYLNEGKIVAIKGIGGYLLACDATNAKAIKRLRERKHRPTKPLAVMYPGIKELDSEFIINNDEQEALTSEVSSIVLLRIKDNKELSIPLEDIAPGINRVGCMIPYTPLYQLILDRFQKPIVATSGNISGSPIIYDDEIAMQEFGSIADALLMNNREIVTPQDDSVISFTTLHNQKIIHRRSRGLAPTYENNPFPKTETSLLALGAQMKSSFSLLSKNRVYSSQYLGDTDSYLTQTAYKHTLTHVQNLLGFKPEALLIDKHPLYFTTEYGNELSEELNIPLYTYQHHKTHFSAVLAENHLLDSSEHFLGVIWDGTGMGDDNNIWGGEFFVFSNGSIERKSHIGYFPFILGDKMPREPRISALCASYGLENSSYFLESKFTSQEWSIYQKVLANHDGLMTSSMGRLFDAVACLLLNINTISYEGEAAIWLEALAEEFSTTTPTNLEYSYFNNLDVLPENISQYLITKVFNDLKKEIATEKIAYCFHISLVDLVRKVATKNTILNIAFSGGVFQNKLLTDMMISLLSDEFRLIFHQQLSPNDECISFGQMACYFLTQNDA